MIARINNQFENGRLFRRLVIVMQFAMLVYVTHLSFVYATHALEHVTFGGTYVVAVITVLQAPIVALMGYSFKIYSNVRSQDVK